MKKRRSRLFSPILRLEKIWDSNYNRQRPLKWRPIIGAQTSRLTFASRTKFHAGQWPLLLAKELTETELWAKNRWAWMMNVTLSLRQWPPKATKRSLIRLRFAFSLTAGGRAHKLPKLALSSSSIWYRSALIDCVAMSRRPTMFPTTFTQTIIMQAWKIFKFLKWAANVECGLAHF